MDALREAVTYAAGRTARELAQDRLLALALVECIEIIGEAASKVSPRILGPVIMRSRGRTSSGCETG